MVERLAQRAGMHPMDYLRMRDVDDQPRPAARPAPATKEGKVMVTFDVQAYSRPLLSKGPYPVVASWTIVPIVEPQLGDVLVRGGKRFTVFKREVGERECVLHVEIHEEASVSP